MSKRFFSIDFLRGLAIFVMLILHPINHVLDIDALVSKLEYLPLVQILILVVLPVFGGMAGFFLLISAIGNMVSMQNQLKRGISTKTMMLRQITGGIILLFFAMLSESVFGYLGIVGDVFRHLNDLSMARYDMGLWRFMHFETVHTIAWCVILNGITHAILTRNNQGRDTNKLIKYYAILAIITIAVTPVLWELADILIPGYPYAIDPETNLPVLYGFIGTSSFPQILLRFFLGPIASNIEPVFPYLAVSYVGSIFGIYITQEKEHVKSSFLRKYFYAGVIAFIIGLVGEVVNLIYVINATNLDTGLEIYIHLFELRYWEYKGVANFAGWLFQFLFVNGIGLCLVAMLFRVIEFRGKAKKWASKTKYIIRLSIVPFTVYTIQWVYFLFFFVVSSIFGQPYVRMNWGGTLLVVLLTHGFFYGLTFIWEKVGFIGSIEGIIRLIGAYIIPSKRSNKALKWWKKGKIDVNNILYNAEWVAFNGTTNPTTEQFAEANLAKKVSIWSLLFTPLAIFALYIVQHLKNKGEPHDSLQKLLKTSRILATMSLGIAVAELFILFTVKLATFGIQL